MGAPIRHNTIIWGSYRRQLFEESIWAAWWVWLLSMRNLRCLGLTSDTTDQTPSRRTSYYAGMSKFQNCYSPLISSYSMQKHRFLVCLTIAYSAHILRAACSVQKTSAHFQVGLDVGMWIFLLVIGKSHVISWYLNAFHKGRIMGLGDSDLELLLGCLS